MARHASPDVPTVLLVDSPQDDRAMYAEYLRACGLNPLETNNPVDALMLATKADVIVTGIRLTGPFDGVELVRRLREGDGTRTKPIIVLTACVLEPDRHRARAAGCDAFLPKPCLPERLASEICSLMPDRELPKPRVAHAREKRNRRAP
jgi:two-component system cell cycle response regulator DivK